MTNNTANHADDTGARKAPRCAAAPLSLIVAILIAAVLQFAAAAKVAHGADVLRRMKDAAIKAEHGLPTDFTPADYTWLVHPDAILRGGIPIEFPISAGEFLLVVLVLAGHRRRAVWLIVPLVFATFFGYALQRTLNGLPCGCFGDLWRPPDGLSMALDAAFVVLALVIAALRRTQVGVLGATVVLSVAGLAGGYLYAARTPAAGSDAARVSIAPHADPSDPGASEASPPPQPVAAGTKNPAPTFDPNMSPAEKLLASDLMKPVREAQAAGDPTAYYIFIWDPTCSTCERLKPVVEEYERQYKDEGNPFLQVLLFKKQDLRDQLSIQTYDWESSPSVFVVRDGAVIELPGGDDSPLPDEILEKLTHDEPLTDHD